ncbi:MAG: AAA family ATPase, partial [Chloroflexi bacterium]|nr:AAA family ATPase [Chloroflexota bacterium]
MCPDCACRGLKLQLSGGSPYSSHRRAFIRNAGRSVLYITRLSLTNFRNYRQLDFRLPPHVVVVCGDNAQGKTNLLEAVYVLATSKSH